MKHKKEQKYLYWLLPLIAVLVVYLAHAFVVYDMNVSKWHKSTRESMAVFSLSLGLVCIVIASIFNKEDEKGEDL